MHATSSFQSFGLIGQMFAYYAANALLRPTEGQVLRILKDRPTEYSLWLSKL